MDDSSQRIIQFPHMLLLKLHFRNKKVESTPRYPKVFGKPQISSDLGLWRDPIAGILERLGSNGGVRLVVAGFSKRKMMVLRRFHQPKIWIYQDSYGFIKKRWKISENPIWTRKKNHPINQPTWGFQVSWEFPCRSLPQFLQIEHVALSDNCRKT